MNYNRIKRDLIRVLIILLGFAIIHLVQGVNANAEAPSETITVDHVLPVQHDLGSGDSQEGLGRSAGDAGEVPSGVFLDTVFRRISAAGTPYGCSADYVYGGNSGNSQCRYGPGSHRVRLSCRDLTNNVVYYVYGGWRPSGLEYYKISWAYCTSLGKPAYAYDAIGAIVQVRTY